MLHFVPFARARREMADPQSQPGLVGQALQLPFPKTQAPTIAVATISVIRSLCASGYKSLTECSISKVHSLSNVPALGQSRSWSGPDIDGQTGERHDA